MWRSSRTAPLACTITPNASKRISRVGQAAAALAQPRRRQPAQARALGGPEPAQRLLM